MPSQKPKLEPVKRVVVYVPVSMDRKLRAKLYGMGTDVSKWFRDKVEELIEEPPK